MRVKRLRFHEEECPVEGLRSFNLVGHPALINEMVSWCRRQRIGFYELHYWNGKAYGFYQVPDHVDLLDEEKIAIVSMTICFARPQADRIVELWSQSCYCEIA
jgi:hypothetical protein